MSKPFTIKQKNGSTAASKVVGSVRRITEMSSDKPNI